MNKLSVNIDHIATLREARKENFQDPVQAAVLSELGGADGITIHLRSDRRHIKERDVLLLRKTIKTELNLEMAATREMEQFALKALPDMVSIVPESPGELTTQGGLDLKKNLKRVKDISETLSEKDVKISVFIEPEIEQIKAALELGAYSIEINTNEYVSQRRDPESIVKKIEKAAIFAFENGLVVHAGHGLDYRNIVNILRIKEINGFSIGFAIIARAVFIGLTGAVREMKRIITLSPLEL